MRRTASWCIVGWLGVALHACGHAPPDVRGDSPVPESGSRDPLPPPLVVRALANVKVGVELDGDDLVVRVLGEDRCADGGACNERPAVGLAVCLRLEATYTAAMPPQDDLTTQDEDEFGTIGGMRIDAGRGAMRATTLGARLPKQACRGPGWSSSVTTDADGRARFAVPAEIDRWMRRGNTVRCGRDHKWQLVVGVAEPADLAAAKPAIPPGQCGEDTNTDFQKQIRPISMRCGVHLEAFDGRLAVEFLINRDGTVYDATIAESSFGNEAATLEECLVTSLKQATFSNRSDASCIIKWPFKFSTDVPTPKRLPRPPYRPLKWPLIASIHRPPLPAAFDARFTPAVIDQRQVELARRVLEAAVHKASGNDSEIEDAEAAVESVAQCVEVLEPAATPDVGQLRRSLADARRRVVAGRARWEREEAARERERAAREREAEQARNGCPFDAQGGVDCELGLCAKIAAKVRAMTPNTSCFPGEPLESYRAGWGLAVRAIDMYLTQLRERGDVARFRAVQQRLLACKPPEWFRNCSN